MGVQNLLKAPFVVQAIKNLSLSDFRLKPVAVEASSYLRFYLYGLHNEERKRWVLKANNHIQSLLKNGIKPVFVFDGTSPKWKNQEQEKREFQKKRKEQIKSDYIETINTSQQKRQKIHHELISSTNESSILSVNIVPNENCKDVEKDDLVKVQITLCSNESNSSIISSITDVDIIDNINFTTNKAKLEELEHIENELINTQLQLKKHMNQIITLTKEDVIDLKTLLTMYKIPFIQSQYESDYVYGSLVRSGETQYIFADDSDTLFYGGNLCRVTLAELNNHKSIRCYMIQEILDETTLSLENFVDFCFSVGTDYSRNGIEQLGIVRGIKLYKEHKSMEKVIEFRTNDCNQKIDDIQLKEIKDKETFEKKINKLLKSKKKTEEDYYKNCCKSIFSSVLKQLQNNHENKEKIKDLNDLMKKDKEFLNFCKNKIYPLIFDKTNDFQWNINWNEIPNNLEEVDNLVINAWITEKLESKQ